MQFLRNIKAPRYLPALAAIALSAAMGFGAPTASAGGVSEDDVKLALLYKIARFISWPQGGDVDGAFRLCVAGESTFRIARERLAERRIGQRAILPILIESRTPPTDCDVVYIADAANERIATVLASVRGAPVLTVSDAPEFAESGGIVGLSTRNSRVQISINVAASRRAGLAISSQLLELATLVEESGGDS